MVRSGVFARFRVRDAGQITRLPAAISYASVMERGRGTPPWRALGCAASLVGAQTLTRTERVGAVVFRPYVPAGDILPAADWTICHGGQNTIVQSLLHNVPLLIFPGPISERRYNAAKTQAAAAGHVRELSDLPPAGCGPCSHSTTATPPAPPPSARPCAPAPDPTAPSTSSNNTQLPPTPRSEPPWATGMNRLGFGGDFAPPSTWAAPRKHAAGQRRACMRLLCRGRRGRSPLASIPAPAFAGRGSQIWPIPVRR